MRRCFAALATIALLTACSSDSSAPDDGGNTIGGRHLTVQVGATQTGIMGQPTSVAPTIIITNDAGSPVAGVVVAFAIASGGGNISSTSATTNASGIASVAWTLGKTFATQALDASVSDVGSVGFHATAIAPDAGILAFNSADVTGDTLPYGGPLTTPAHDLVGIRGDFKRDSLILTLTFAGPVSDAALGGATGLFGFVEFDIDDKVTTGNTPEANVFGATATLGIDFILDLFDEFGARKAVILSPTDVTVVTSTFSGNSVVVRIPMQLLGGDDGLFSIVGVMGLIDRATDILPNTDGLAIRPN